MPRALNGPHPQGFLTDNQIAAILRHKHGWEMTRVRVWQIRMEAERKIRRALEKLCRGITASE